MEITQIVNQIGLITAKLLLTIAFIYLTFMKYENKDNIKIPMPVLVLLFTYTLIILMSFILMGEINILFVLFYIIIFVCLIFLIFLSLNNFNLKQIIKDNIIDKLN